MIIRSLSLPNTPTLVADKNQIVLSATGSMWSARLWAADQNPMTLPPFVIDRDGTLYRLFAPNRAGEYMGIPEVDHRAIHIALCNVGPLKPYQIRYFYPVAYDKNSMPYADTSQPAVLPYEFCTSSAHHGFTHYEYITPAQISTLSALLPNLLRQFNINYIFDPLTGGITPNFAKGRAGIFLACGYDGRRTDLHPQNELINLLKSL